MTQNNRTETATRVWINGRFLERAVTGVERVGFELVNALATTHLDANGCWSDGHQTYRFVLLAPASSTAPSPWRNIELVRGGRFNGHAWEQFDVPRLTRNEWLINMCNTGPLFKRRQLIFMHDAQPFVIPQNFSLSFRLWYRLLFKVAGRCAARVLVNSAFTKSELHRHAGIAAAKMDLCYLGTEHLDRVQSAADVDEKLTLPDQKFVLAVSSANPNKNFGAVLAALEHLGDAAPPCVIVGHRDQKHFERIKLDSGKVHHLGYVSDAQLQVLFQRALCLVFPSFYEGFGLPPLEAMTLGCPVIASNTSVMPEVCGDGAQYCDPHDPRSLAQVIRRVSASPALQESMQRAGRQRAEGFSWSTGGQTLLNSLQRAVSEF